MGKRSLDAAVDADEFFKLKNPMLRSGWDLRQKQADMEQDRLLDKPDSMNPGDIDNELKRQAYKIPLAKEKLPMEPIEPAEDLMDKVEPPANPAEKRTHDIRKRVSERPDYIPEHIWNFFHPNAI